jgi:hypothetical protein
MRFLFGIVSGAGAVLALALAAGVDRNALLVEAREALTEARGVAAAWLEGWRGSEPIPPAPRVDPVPEPRAEPKAQPKAERDPEPAALPENVLPELPEAVTVDLLAEREAAPASVPAPGMQAVWVPFRSERSATGFAERLAARLDHPFEVRRRGPGVYEVAFAYGGEAERAQLLERVRAATGAAP